MWSHLEPFRVIWRHLEAFGVNWSHLNPFGAIWSHLNPFGATCSYLESFVAIWSHLVCPKTRDSPETVQRQSSHTPVTVQNIPETVQRQSRDSLETGQGQSSNSPETAQRQSSNSPETVQRQSRDSPETVQRQPRDSQSRESPELTLRPQDINHPSSVSTFKGQSNIKTVVRVTTTKQTTKQSSNYRACPEFSSNGFHLVQSGVRQSDTKLTLHGGVMVQAHSILRYFSWIGTIVWIQKILK